MKENLFPIARYSSLLIMLMFPFCQMPLLAEGLQTQLNEAYASYMQGANADTVPEQEAAFNRALKLYAQLEQEPGNGKLFYNMANIYYELGEYGWAIYYYRQAQQLLPRNDQIRQQLTRTLIKQGLMPPMEKPVAQNVLYWQYKMSQSERILLFVALFSLTLFLASLLVWIRREPVKILFGLVASCSALVLGSILYAQYFAPFEAIVVGAYGIYHAPSEESAIVSGEPLIPGTSIEVRAMIDDGSWLRISTPSGQTGYLPSEAARIVL